MRSALATSLLGYSAQAIHRFNQDELARQDLLEQFAALHQHWSTRGIMAALMNLANDSRLIERLLGAEQGERRLTNFRHLAELLAQTSEVEPAKRSNFEPVFASSILLVCLVLGNIGSVSRRDIQKVGRALGINGVWGNMGIATAPIIAGALIDAFSWREAFIVPGVISILTGIAYALFCRQEARRPAAAAKPVIDPDASSLTRSILVRVAFGMIMTILFVGLRHHVGLCEFRQSDGSRATGSRIHHCIAWHRWTKYREFCHRQGHCRLRSRYGDRGA